ncbi:MAG: polysaccharide deacetylase family protein [Oscillospiraceae bacterium]|jgi:peptidoglycan/xylan/chitin deacetylase (PgdA/CDA1 family)|nr:polysaccharide deacetylase family protein [Oscillospiraceae bacterium]
MIRKLRPLLWALPFLCLRFSDLPTHAYTDAVPLLVVTYHSLSERPEDWSSFVVSPEELESDLRYLRDQGYESVLSADLIAYMDESAPLPERPVLLTFDDGYRDNYVYAYPLLRAYGMRAVISLIGECLDASDAGDDSGSRYYLSWDEAREMADTGVVELGSHTYGLHRNTGGRLGASLDPNEDLDAYTARLTGDLMQMQQRTRAKTGRAPLLFAYPYGAVSYSSRPVVKALGFRVSLSTQRGLSLIAREDPDSLFLLHRINRPHGITSEDFFSLHEIPIRE